MSSAGTFLAAGVTLGAAIGTARAASRLEHGAPGPLNDVATVLFVGSAVLGLLGGILLLTS